MATLVQDAHRLSTGRRSVFQRFAWGVLAWNVLVIIWGAFVRASGSGAGCGNHWPLCNGVVVPHSPQVATFIEFTHRLMSGVALIGVAVLAYWSYRSFPRHHPVRRWATASAAFLLLEALLGAGLVLFDYVAGNASVGRVIYLCAHLVNTLLLLATLSWTAWFVNPRHPAQRALTGFARPAYTWAALTFAVFVSVTGVIAALGDTLFPAISLNQGYRQDFSAGAHFLLRLRILHPVFASAFALLVVLIAFSRLRPETERITRRLAAGLAALAVIQLMAGAFNLVLLAPVWMQLLHLLLADALWITLVLFAAQSIDRLQFSPKRLQAVKA